MAKTLDSFHLSLYKLAGIIACFLHFTRLVIIINDSITKCEEKITTVLFIIIVLSIDIGTYLLLAVKKMKGDIANMIQFKNIQLMGVEPPSSKDSYYKLPGSFKQSEIDAKYALFDSSGRVGLQLWNTILCQFSSIINFMLIILVKTKYLRKGSNIVLYIFNDTII